VHILGPIGRGSPRSFTFLEEKALEFAKKKRDRLLALVVAGSFLIGTAAPARAAENMAPGLDPRPTLTDAASGKVEALSNEALAATAVQTAAAAPAENSGGFFKSGKGKAAMVLMIAAVGITVFSKYHDRVKSVIR